MEILTSYFIFGQNNHITPQPGICTVEFEFRCKNWQTFLSPFCACISWGIVVFNLGTWYIGRKGPQKTHHSKSLCKKTAPLTTLVQKKPQHSKSLCKKNRITQNPCVKKTAALKILVQTKPHHSKSLCKQNRITQNPCKKNRSTQNPCAKKNRTTHNPCVKKTQHSKSLCKKTASLKTLV